MSAAAERLLRRIEAIDTAAAENRQRAEAYAAMGEELKQVTGEATSLGGAVTVVAAPGGIVKDIVFTAAVSSTPPAELARSVRAAVTQAQAEVARKQAEIVRRGLGDTELLDRVLESDHRVFGAPARPAEAPPSPAPARRRATPRPAEDTDFDEGFSVFGDGR